VLDQLDVEVDDVRQRIRTKVGEGESATTGQIPFTPRAKRTLALREALSLGHNYIGTEHILLALVRDDGGLASEILRELGADRDVVQDCVIGTLGVGAVIPLAAHGGTVHSIAPAFMRRRGPRPWPQQETLPQRRGLGHVQLVLVGWALFALALGAGILIGWAIWG
jgi:Clp amino terminal domain, pathogenicity island component